VITHLWVRLWPQRVLFPQVPEFLFYIYL